MKVINVGIAMLAVVLGGCAATKPTVVTEVTPVVIKPPESLYKCPIETKFPEQPTNKQVANLIVKLDKNNKTCYTSLQSIKKYVNEAEVNFKKEARP